MLDNIMPAIGMGMTDMGLGLKQRAYEFMVNRAEQVSRRRDFCGIGHSGFQRKTQIVAAGNHCQACHGQRTANAPGGTIGSIIGRAALLHRYLCARWRNFGRLYADRWPVFGNGANSRR